MPPDIICSTHNSERTLGLACVLERERGRETETDRQTDRQTEFNRTDR